MRRIVLIVICPLLVVFPVYGKSEFNVTIGTSTEKNDLQNFCQLMERLKVHSLGKLAEFRKKRSDMTAVQARSYYGYGGASPAYYTAFDPISVLASLAFLAFLLQSFASLFDRSRSIIPAIVSSRESSSPIEIPDPMRLVMRALDEYDLLNHNIELEKQK